MGLGEADGVGSALVVSDGAGVGTGDGVTVGSPMGGRLEVPDPD